MVQAGLTIQILGIYKKNICVVDLLLQGKNDLFEITAYKQLWGALLLTMFETIERIRIINSMSC